MRGDGATRVERIGAIDEADAATLTFAVDAHYLRAAANSRAAAVLTDEAALSALGAPVSKPLIVVGSTRAALAALLRALAPARPPAPFRHPSAAVDESARVGPDVHVGPFVTIGADAEVGANCVLLAGSVVGAGARLGPNSTLHPRAMLLDGCIAGARVVLQAGAVVGSDGFGYVFMDGAFVKIPQVGNVVLGDDVEIGANACVDRAQTGSTTIGRGTKVDNLVQIAHNCKIGANCGFAALSGFSGSTTVGDYTVIGGHSATRGHMRVGARVKAAGNTMMWSDIPDGAFVSGNPAQDHREELRQKVRLKGLGKLIERVNALERK